MRAAYIYKLNFGNGYYYIGSSVEPDKRLYNHLLALRNGNHDNIAMQKVFNKYGFDKMQILEECDESVRWSLEASYIEPVYKDRKCLNREQKPMSPPKYSAPKRFIPTLVNVKTGQRIPEGYYQWSEVERIMGVPENYGKYLRPIIKNPGAKRGDWMVEGVKKSKADKYAGVVVTKDGVEYTLSASRGENSKVLGKQWTRLFEGDVRKSHKGWRLKV